MNALLVAGTLFPCPCTLLRGSSAGITSKIKDGKIFVEVWEHRADGSSVLLYATFVDQFSLVITAREILSSRAPTSDL